MAIDYRYHVGSLVSIFVALLLGILIGIGLAPKDPEQLNQAVSKLRDEYSATKQESEANLEKLRQSDAVAREAVAAVIAGRLAGKRVALVLSHDLGRDLPNNLRATLTQAGASVDSTTTIGHDLVSLSQERRDALCRQLLFYPPSDQPIRPLLAQFMARDFLEGAPKTIPELQKAGLLQSTQGSTYDARVDAVVVVGGMDDANQAAPEQIDVPLMKELVHLGFRVVGCEATTAKLSTIPLYKAVGVPTVDDIDAPAGRLSLVLTLAGVSGHYGVRETADRLLPVIPPTKSQ